MGFLNLGFQIYTFVSETTTTGDDGADDFQNVTTVVASSRFSISTMKRVHPQEQPHVQPLDIKKSQRFLLLSSITISTFLYDKQTQDFRAFVTSYFRGDFTFIY